VTSYLTPRKRARALGAAHEGAGHHWRMIVSSALLLVLVPLFVIILGPTIGRPYPEVVARLARPFPAIVLGLGFLVGLLHFRQGAQVMIEDYAGGLARKGLLIAMIAVVYVILAVGLLAVARLAF
jgi:succinate dehydrogenase / fumarate reductase membrane anchor subunit